MDKKIKSILLLFVVFLVGITIANVSFAATDNIGKDKTTGYFNELNYKGSASNLKVQTFVADRSPVDGVYQKNDKKYYTFTAKKKNHLIKSISVKYEFYDRSSSAYKNITKTYKFKNKKSVTIELPRYVKNEMKSTWVPSGYYGGYNPVGTVYFSYHDYSRPYNVLKYTIKYSNKKKEDSSKFSSASSHYQQRTYSGKKTNITRLYKISLSTSNITGNIKYTIQANKKTAKIKKVAMKFEYYDSNSQKYVYKNIQVNGKGKNSVVKNIPKTYYFVSAKVTY